MTARRLRRLLLVACLVVPPLVWLAMVSRPEPPLRLVASAPQQAATLATGPVEVSLTWSAPVDPARSHVAVSGADGRQINAGPIRTGGPEVLRVPVRVPGGGDYTVAYHVAGAGGGEASGTVRFTVGQGPAAAAPAGTSQHVHEIDPMSAVLLLANFAAVVAAVLLLVLRPAPGHARSRRSKGWSSRRRP